MATVRCFEELRVWQRSRQLALEVHRGTASFQRHHEYDLMRQLRRSAYSVPANIAEGFERGSRREMMHFLAVAKGSCGELRSHLSLAVGLGLMDGTASGVLRREAITVGRGLGALIRYLNASTIPGSRWRAAGDTQMPKPPNIKP